MRRYPRLIPLLALLATLAEPALAAADERPAPATAHRQKPAQGAAHLRKPAPSPPARHQTTVSPERFFAGRTEGRGELRVFLSAPRAIRVHGTGRLTRNGTLILRQTIEQQGKPAERREWRLRRTAPDRFEGTLTGAAGPVKGEISGNSLHLGYFTKGGVRIDQTLTFDHSGRVADNRLTARILGLPVARLEETIRKKR